MKIANIDYNLEANLTEEQFKDTFKGILKMDLDEAWKIIEKHTPKKECETVKDFTPKSVKKKRK